MSYPLPDYDVENTSESVIWADDCEHRLPLPREIVGFEQLGLKEAIIDKLGFKTKLVWQVNDSGELRSTTMLTRGIPDV